MFLVTFIKAIGRLFAKVFTSKEAQDVMKTILETILPEAVPIVQQIREMVSDPGKATAQDVIDLYKSFGRTAQGIYTTRQWREHALLDLATEILREKLPQKYSTPLLHSAIELALSGLKARG